MSENNQGEKGLFEMLEDKTIPESYICESSNSNASSAYDEEHKYEFQVHDMFLDHFFP